jgi:hypothetical protein
VGSYKYLISHQNYLLRKVLALLSLITGFPNTRPMLNFPVRLQARNGKLWLKHGDLTATPQA